MSKSGIDVGKMRIYQIQPDRAPCGTNSFIYEEETDGEVMEPRVEVIQKPKRYPDDTSFIPSFKKPRESPSKKRPKKIATTFIHVQCERLYSKEKFSVSDVFNVLHNGRLSEVEFEGLGTFKPGIFPDTVNTGDLIFQSQIPWCDVPKIVKVKINIPFRYHLPVRGFVDEGNGGRETDLFEFFEDKIQPSISKKLWNVLTNLLSKQVEEKKQEKGDKTESDDEDGGRDNPITDFSNVLSLWVKSKGKFSEEELAKFIAEHSARKRTENPCGHTLFMQLAAIGAIDLMKFMIKYETCYINSVDNFGNNALHWAYYFNNQESIDFLEDLTEIDATKENYVGKLPSEFLKVKKISDHQLSLVPSNSKKYLVGFFKVNKEIIEIPMEEDGFENLKKSRCAVGSKCDFENRISDISVVTLNQKENTVRYFVDGIPYGIQYEISSVEIDFEKLVVFLGKKGYKVFDNSECDGTSRYRRVEPLQEIVSVEEHKLKTLKFERSLVGRVFSDYTIVKPIGGRGLSSELSGAMSAVYHVKFQGKDLVMKIRLNYCSRMMPTEFLRRLPFHPNILRIHHRFFGTVRKERVESSWQFDDRLAKSKTAFFIMQYCESSLKEQSLRNGIPVFKTKKDFFSFLHQVVSGLNVLKKNNFIHRDLKIDNIMIKDGRYVIGDFGMCFDFKHFPECKIPNLPGVLRGGAPLYMPPEIIDRYDYGMDNFLVFDKYDVYSLGMVCFQLFTRRLPNHLSKLISRECKSGTIRIMVEKMMASYERRFSVEELLEEVKKFV